MTIDLKESTKTLAFITAQTGAKSEIRPDRYCEACEQAIGMKNEVHNLTVAVGPDKVVLPPPGLNNTDIIWDYWLSLPVDYQRIVLSTLAVCLGVLAGLMTPWLAEALEHLF